MTPSGVITLLTDFGLRDPFVGILHGVILSRAPAARIVDLCHGVAPQAVDEAAFWLERCHLRFPPGTIHVAVVDPGVGTTRAALVVRARDQLFVAPDNGLLGELARDGEVRHIDLERVGLSEPCRTFHGRDVFAPVAADLCSGRLSFDAVGPRAQAQRLVVPAGGRVVGIDHFGNLVTNIDRAAPEAFSRPLVVVAGCEVPVAGTYADVPAGECVAVVGSFDTLEICVRNGSAAQQIGVARGAPVALREA